jgi:hypothetical protein
MHNFQLLEKEIELALLSITRMKKEKQELLGRIKVLEAAIKEVEFLKAQNIAWQKNKNMLKSKIEKIIKNLELLEKADEE